MGNNKGGEDSVVVDEDPEVEITLSRPSYRVGGTVVGTVRVFFRNNNHNAATSSSESASETTTIPPIRQALYSLQLVLVGRCRLDPRWHNFKDCMRQLEEEDRYYRGSTRTHTKSQLLRNLPSEPNTFVFWATEPLELLELHERTVGRWEEVRPDKPIRLPGGGGGARTVTSSSRRRSSLEAEGENLSSSSSSQEEAPLEAKQLAFTFRADLVDTSTSDEDDNATTAKKKNALPHSMSSSSCRYSYKVALLVVYNNNNSKTQPENRQSMSNKPRHSRWIQIPFTVLTQDPEGGNSGAVGRQSSVWQRNSNGLSCQAMAHSSGLPCAVTALELNQLGGQLTVNRHGPSLYRHLNSQTPGHLQTMRVSDPSGAPVCILTMMGLTPLSPGSRFILKFDFPMQQQKDSSTTASWVPCHQVSACLQGEEVVIRKDLMDSSSQQNQKINKRARAYMFDTAHEWIDPQCTERTCLHLLLPPDAPCTLETDLIEINIWCTVDLSVEKNTGSSGGTGSGGGYQNLRLEIPCQVVHSAHAYERREYDTAGGGDVGDVRQQKALSIEELMGYEPSSDPREASSFYRRDIAEDLKILSLHMAEKCGLKPQPPYAQS